MSTCIKPCKSLSEKFHIQVTFLKIYSVQICDLQLSTSTRFQILSILYNLVIIEIQSCYTVIALWFLRLFFDRNRFSCLVKFNDTKTLRIVYIISKYSSALTCLCIFHSSFQTLVQTMSCENVIAKNHCHCIITDKFFTDDKCLSQSVRAWLHCI